MLLIYGECYQNSLAASREYAARFPERRHPNVNVFLRLITRTRETGSVIPVKKEVGGRERHVRINENEETILLAINEDPSVSIRELSRRFEVSKSSVQRILMENKMHPYHYTRVQNLHPQDYRNRLNFCEWLLEQEENQPGFVRTILFTDESCFTREGVFNIHNCHIWSDENPNEYTIRNYQRRFSVNLWAGILNDLIIGPFEMPVRLNSARYNNFLIDDLPELMESVPLNIRQNMMYQQDGAPPHNSHIVRQTLNRKFVRGWIGRGGPVSWPARSPDLTPLDFFLWGHIKQYVYKEPIDSRIELQDKIVEAFATITPNMVGNAATSLLRRAQLCIECNGGQFEQLL